jgi:hypothetical protein
MGKVLIITGADFSKNKIKNINVIGGKLIDITDIKKNTYIAVQSGKAIETSISGWSTSEFIKIEDYFTNINGYSNFYHTSTVISGMVCFYDEGYNFLSYNNEMKKIDKAEGGVTKGWFNFIKPTGTKYIKMSWQSDSLITTSIVKPTLYFR